MKERTTLLNELFDKYTLDNRLRNRENVALIKKVIKDNCEKKLTIQRASRAIINQNYIQETIDTELWGRALLLYDENYFYYCKSNPLLNKYKARKEKIKKIIFFIPRIPIELFKLQIKFILAMFGIDKETITKGTATSSSYQSFDYRTATGIPDTINKEYGDTVGTLRYAGENFLDSQSILRSPGEQFYDSQGILRRSGENFYDSQGILREPGAPYYN